ncbi:MAG: FAD-dependent monooxygenase, partial [Bacteroidota bacterium]
MLSQLLQRAGIGHVVLSRTKKQRGPALGETLPPSAYALLDQLNLTALFERHGTRTFGYHARWGSEKLSSQEFFGQRPRPYGLKLDKAALLAGLGAATASNVVSIEAVHGIATDADGASITYQAGQRMCRIRAGIVVDATGRARAVVKRLGIGQQAFDSTVATTCHVPRHRHPQLGHAVYVESCAGRGGLVSPLVEARSAMTLFTNKGNPLLRELRHFSGWRKALSETVSLKDFLAPEHLGAIAGQPANTSRAKALAGDCWLAVGDAAIAFDPL